MDHRTSSPRLVPPRRLWHLSSWLLSHASGRAYKLVVDELGHNGRADYAILAGLEEFAPISQAELGRRLGFDRKNIVVALDRLGADGRTKRAADPTDPRRNTITITPAGRATLRRADEQLAAAHGALLEPLTAQERQQLDALLQRLVEHHYGGPQREAAKPGDSLPA